MPLHVPNVKTLITLLLFFAAFVGAVALAKSLSENQQALQVVEQFGYVGIVILAMVAGVNAVVPIPAATLTPVFVGAGLTIPLIILCLTIGTLIADFVGFFIGKLSSEMIKDKHPKTFAFIYTLRTKKGHLVLPLLALYVAFAPLPNELVLLPLGMSGYRFGALLIPLIVGNLINQTLLVYGISSFGSAFL